MGCAVRIFSVLVSLGIIFTGFITSSSGFLGSGSPEFGIPIMVIGAGLFLFIVVVSILGTKWPTAMETFVITIGVILLVIGVERIKVAVESRSLLAWPIIICIAGSIIVLCHRQIVGRVHRYFKPRGQGK